MLDNAWKKMWHSSIEARRWMLIASALDVLSEDYEAKTGIPVTATLTPNGVCIETEFEGGELVEFMDHDEILEVSPQAYALYQLAKNTNSGENNV